MTAPAKTAEVIWIYRDALAVRKGKDFDHQRKRWMEWRKQWLDARAEAEFRQAEGDAAAAEDLEVLRQSVTEACGEGMEGSIKAARFLFDAEVIDG